MRGIVPPCKRLLAATDIAAANFSGEDMYAFDIGCDHAKLAIYLVQKDICKHVVAADINDGPIEKARLAVRTRTKKGESLDSYIDVVKTDGLKGLEKYRCNCVFICGMGGETIVEILEQSPYIKNRDTVYVFQPQSRDNLLRQYLLDEGFYITKELVMRDAGRLYTIFSCRYDGQKRKCDILDAFFGEYALHEDKTMYAEKLLRSEKYLKERLEAKCLSGADTEKELRLNERINQMKGFLGI